MSLTPVALKSLGGHALATATSSQTVVSSGVRRSAFIDHGRAVSAMLLEPS